MIKLNDKLNIGCGLDIKQGYVNIDCRELPGVDLVTDITKLEIEHRLVSEIYISDFLEHFSEKDGNILFTKFYTWLKPDGILDIRIPDLKAVAKEIIERPTFMPMIYRIYGGQDYPSNFHYWGWTPESFKEYITSYNYEIIKEEYDSWNMRFILKKK